MSMKAIINNLRKSSTSTYQMYLIKKWRSSGQKQIIRINCSLAKRHVLKIY